MRRDKSNVTGGWLAALTFGRKCDREQDNQMRLRISVSIVVAVALCAAFGLGYRSGYTQASKRTVIFERDTADTPGQGSAKAGYDPYFSKANPIPTEVK